MIHYVNQSRDRQGAYAFLETAGGIHSPVMSGKVVHISIFAWMSRGHELSFKILQVHHRLTFIVR